MRRYIIALVILYSVSSWAYTPPIGIPDPGWGIDEVMPSRPVGWSSEEIAGYYYINAGTGNDSGRTYGCPEAPRRTIPTLLSKGSYVEIHGNYAVANPVLLRGDTTGDNATNGNSWSAGADGPAWVTMSVDPIGCFITYMPIIYGQYVYADGICVSGNIITQIGRPAINAAADHVMIRNSTVSGDNETPRTGLLVIGSASASSSNVIVYNNTLSGFGAMDLTKDADGPAIFVSEYTSNTWILENTIYNAANVGIFIGAQTGKDPDIVTNTYVGKNTIRDTNITAVGSKSNRGLFVSENIAYNIHTRPWSPGRCFGVQHDFQDAWFVNNTCYNSPRGFRAAGSENNDDANDTTHEVYIIGNLFYNIGMDYTCTDVTDNSSWCRETVAQQATYTAMGSILEAAVEIAGGTEFHITNNSAYNVSSGVIMSSAPTTLVIENNAFSVNDDGGYQIWIGGNLANAITIRNDILYQSAGDWIGRWGSTNYTTLETWQAASSKGADCVVTDPKFSNPTTSFTLSSDSPAIGTALAAESLTTDVFALFTTNYSLDIAKDISGTTRPQQTTWDIGAYEYVPASGAALKGRSTGSGGWNMR